MSNNNKVLRFFNAINGVQPGRMGTCNPEKCSTLNGKQGAACCQMDNTCLFLCTGCKVCKIYEVRPINCRAFPTSADDLKLVKNCGYYWPDYKGMKFKIVV
jgi:Fe-S-cluster containining protein